MKTDLLPIEPGCRGSYIPSWFTSPVHVCLRDGEPCEREQEGDDCPRSGINMDTDSELIRDARGDRDVSQAPMDKG